jgi:HAD superfamily hydrolase (TIGR01490 family)
MELALFDFDGTITTHDSFSEFLFFCFGWKGVISRGIPLLPQLAGFSAGLVSREKVKQKVCDAFFAGMTQKEFAELAGRFCASRLPAMIRPKAAARLAWHKEQGHRVIVVSASFCNYLRFWCDEMKVELIATVLEEKDGRMTGRFATPNCWGPEKVKRIMDSVDLASYEKIYAYGDSRGDKEMLEIAHEKGLRFFS